MYLHCLSVKEYACTDLLISDVNCPKYYTANKDNQDSLRPLGSRIVVPASLHGTMLTFTTLSKQRHTSGISLRYLRCKV